MATAAQGGVKTRECACASHPPAWLTLPPSLGKFRYVLPPPHRACVAPAFALVSKSRHRFYLSSLLASPVAAPPPAPPGQPQAAIAFYSYPSTARPLPSGVSPAFRSSGVYSPRCEGVPPQAEMAQGRGNATRILLMLAALALLQVATAKDIKVGGTLGWDYPPGTDVGYYNTWAATQTFNVGDNLLFVYTAGAHDAQVVSEAEYSGCLQGDGKKYTSGNDKVPLTTAGDMYFLCSFITHCEMGMKVKITVKAAAAAAPPATPPSPPPSPPPATPPATPPAPRAAPPTPPPAPAPVPSAIAPVPAPVKAPVPSPVATPAPVPMVAPPTPAPEPATPPPSAETPTVLTPPSVEGPAVPPGPAPGSSGSSLQVCVGAVGAVVVAVSALLF